MMLDHVRRDLAVVAGLLVLGVFLVIADARGQQPDAKKQDPKTLPIPDLDKLLPPGTIDPEQLKELKKMLADQKDQMKKVMEDLKKKIQGQFPDFEMPKLALPFGAAEPENRLGAELQRPSRTLVEQLDLPENQGIVLRGVKEQSAAAKAGMRANDILLEIDGKAVPSNVDDVVKQLNAIKKKAVDAVVLRKGKRETVKGLKLDEVPAPGGIQFQQQGGGISVSQSRGSDGSFATQFQEGNLSISVTGKIDGKKAEVASIVIRGGDKSNTFKAVDDVPEAYRDDVRALIEAVETGQAFTRKK
jgi:membrane-associated protease RseP (regulator of RpoE activity)